MLQIFRNKEYEKLDFSFSQLQKKLSFVDVQKKRLVLCHSKVVTLPRKSRTFIHWGIGPHEKHKPKNERAEKLVMDFLWCLHWYICSLFCFKEQLGSPKKDLAFSLA